MEAGLDVISYVSMNIGRIWFQSFSQGNNAILFFDFLIYFVKYETLERKQCKPLEDSEVQIHIQET